MATPRPPLPPFDLNSAVRKVRLAEDAWNTRDPERVAQAYTVDSVWRNRAEFPGRAAIVEFLTRKWSKELDYRLIKELWAFPDNRIAVRFAYEWHDDARPVVPLLRQRELGVRRRRAHGAALRQHQRPADRGPTASSAGRSAAGRTTTGALRPGPVIHRRARRLRGRRCRQHPRVPGPLRRARHRRRLGTRYGGREKIRAWSDGELIGVDARLETVSSEQRGADASVLAQVSGHPRRRPDLQVGRESPTLTAVRLLRR